jgi:hypothetical protein
MGSHHPVDRRPDQTMEAIRGIYDAKIRAGVDQRW